MAISVGSFSFSRAVQPEAWGPNLSGTCSHSSILSLIHLISNSLTSCLHQVILVQSPTQSLEWHAWSSSSGNNCHAVHRSLSSGASVNECTMGFYLVPYFQPSPPTRFLLITAIGMCHFLLVHHFGMACLAGSKVNIQHRRLINKCKNTEITAYWVYFLHKGLTLFSMVISWATIYIYIYMTSFLFYCQLELE